MSTVESLAYDERMEIKKKKKLTNIERFYVEEHSTFANVVIEEEHEMINMEDIMTILHQGNHQEKST